MLINKLNKEQSLQKIAKEKFKRITISFYKYVKVQDPSALRDELFEKWSKWEVFGRIYLANEGINAQMCVPEIHFDEFKNDLYSYVEFKDVPFKIGLEQEFSFWKLTIKVKKQIVADALTEDDYDVTNVGKHLNAEEFNQAMDGEDAIVVDMRNHYESRIGKFENAICPDSDTFREELPMVKELLKGKEDKKVLLYCTGGIRCEKASAYLKHNGFKDVNQLYGGIINYVHEIKEKQLKPKFIGKNFVFDERIAESVTDDVLTNCDQCNESCDNYVNCSNAMCNLLFIQCNNCNEKMQGTCCEECQTIINLPEEELKELHRKQKPTDLQVYKSRLRPRKVLVGKI